MSSSIF